MSDRANYLGSSNIQAHGSNAAASCGTTLTAPGSLNTKGAYTQLVASTTYPFTGVLVQFNCEPGSGDDFVLLDVAIGAAASEQVIIPNLVGCRLSSTLGNFSQVYVPVQIPSGSRISMRYQVAVSATAIVTGQVIGFTQSGKLYPPPMVMADYGTATGTSSGTAVDPGATPNTKGAYSQIVASTTLAIRGLIVQVLPKASYAAVPAHSLIDIAIGGAGSEQVVVPNYAHNPPEVSGSAVVSAFPSNYLPVYIPAGSRIAMRSQCDTGTAGNRSLYCSLIGCS